MAILNSRPHETSDLDAHQESLAWRCALRLIFRLDLGVTVMFNCRQNGRIVAAPAEWGRAAPGRLPKPDLLILLRPIVIIGSRTGWCSSAVWCGRRNEQLNRVGPVNVDAPPKEAAQKSQWTGERGIASEETQRHAAESTWSKEFMLQLETGDGRECRSVE
ncbi:hypothetical protein K438DRAFT_1756015 [Mycena galopus ATCC 62051]|nr:hypothetical protein K438DRAFT_1756015 [Mycena galopus ATCC 62051]